MEFQENSIETGVEDVKPDVSQEEITPDLTVVDQVDPNPTDLDSPLKADIDEHLNSDSATEESKICPDSTANEENEKPISSAKIVPEDNANNGHVQELYPSQPNDSSASSDKRTSWPAVWLEDHLVDERVISLIYWNEWQKSAAVFGGVLLLLLSLAYYPFLYVVTMFMKAMLAVSFLYRIGMTIVNAVQKTSAEHPLRNLLDEKIEISEDMIKEWPELARVQINSIIKQAQHLFLINDFIDSLKFGVLLWLVSYFACWFSLLTLVTIPIVSVFTLPIVYEQYQNEINHGVDIGKSKVLEIYDLVDSKVPPKFKFYSSKKMQ